MPATLVADLDPSTVIWRYMTLDKLIDLLESKALYFTSLLKYARTDPFEGLPPQLILKKMYEVHQASAKQVLDLIPEKDRADNFDLFVRNAKTIFKSQVVNCWYANADESEAMWKIYGENHKGIAIRTTVGGLQNALPQDDARIKIGAVSYIDYHNPKEGSLRSHVSSGLGPLIKRLSYEHEREIRAFFLPTGVDVTKPVMDHSQTRPVEISYLIEEIVVSPYAGKTYVNAVKAMARLFGYGEKVRVSTLLDEADEVFNFGTLPPVA